MRKSFAIFMALTCQYINENYLFIYFFVTLHWMYNRGLWCFRCEALKKLLKSFMARALKAQTLVDY